MPAAKTMREIEWHPEAGAEFRSSGRHYERQLAGLGARFGQAILTAIIKAADDPRRYQRIDMYCQIIRVKRFPYSVIYQEIGRGIRIVAVMHHRRRPGFWKDRVGH